MLMCQDDVGPQPWMKFQKLNHEYTSVWLIYIYVCVCVCVCVCFKRQSDFICSQSLADPAPPNSFGFIKKYKYISVTDHTEEDYALYTAAKHWLPQTALSTQINDVDGLQTHAVYTIMLYFSMCIRSCLKQKVSVSISFFFTSLCWFHLKSVDT